MWALRPMLLLLLPPLLPTTAAAAATAATISVVADIPGRARSRHYAVSAQAVGGEQGGWQRAFVLESTAKDVADAGYFSALNGFTNSWASVMLGQANTGGVRLRVSRLGDGAAATIKTAVVHPPRSGATVTAITDHGVEVLVPRPAQFTLTLDGGLDDVDTGPGYKGPPLHTFTAVVNPFLAAPAAGPGVVTVQAGQAIPDPLPPSTQAIVFGPGEHRLHFPPGGEEEEKEEGVGRGPPPPSSPHWPVYTLPGAVKVHVPADAICYFALDGPPPPARVNISLEGYGTFSGEEIDRCAPNATAARRGDAAVAADGEPPSFGEGKACGGAENKSPQGLTLGWNVHHASIAGVTFVDYPNHHIIAQATGNKQPCVAPPSTMTNIKIFGWRANGDGIHVFGQWEVSDCFIRTQDDSMYLTSGGAGACPTVVRRSLRPFWRPCCLRFTYVASVLVKKY
jgi:hypothetical protein